MVPAAALSDCENDWKERKYPASSESPIVSRSRASPTATARGCGTDERSTRSRNAALSANCSTSRAGDGREALLELRREAGDRVRPGVAAGKEDSAFELERAEVRLDAVLVS